MILPILHFDLTGQLLLTISIRMMRNEDEFVFAPQTGNRAWGLPVVKGGEEQGMG